MEGNAQEKRRIRKIEEDEETDEEEGDGEAEEVRRSRPTYGKRKRDGNTHTDIK